MSARGHETVLHNEALDALDIRPDGHYVDCTYGRGGHAGGIIERLGPAGRLTAIDRDDAACRHARERWGDDERVRVVHAGFGDLASVLTDTVDGILLDLGVSSPQLDEAERGFSFMADGPLDMRMDQASGEPVHAWLARATAADITRVLREFGEERFARRIAAAIVQQRDERPILTTRALADLVREATPRIDPHKHPATRSFQALRIFINDELGQLKACLEASIDALGSGGRLVVISFHSLEDRIVKRFIRRMADGAPLPRNLPIRDADIERWLRVVGKPVKPSADEVARNARARSAIMRVAERLPA